MKKADFIVITFGLLFVLFLGVLFIKENNKKIEEENIAIEVLYQNESLVTLSLDEEGLFTLEIKDNVLTLKNETSILVTKNVTHKDCYNSFEIKNGKVLMCDASCNGKDCTKMYITQNHLVPIICTNGIVLYPTSITNIDVIV